MNAHYTIWHSYPDDHRGQQIVDVISNSDHITLNTNTPTECQTPHYNKHIHQISPRCLTHCTTGHRRQLNTYYNQTSYSSSPQSTYDMTTDYNKPTDFHQLQESRLDTINGRHRVRFRSYHNTHQHTHTVNIIFTNIILMADKHNIPKGKMHAIATAGSYPTT